MLEHLPRGWRGRAFVAAFAAGAVTSAWNLAAIVQGLSSTPGDTDFRSVYAGALIGLSQGWTHLYDPAVNRAVNTALYPPSAIWPIPPTFSLPPPAAWLVEPLTKLPLAAATWVWAGLELVALVVAVFLVVRASTPARIVVVLAVLGLFPTEIALAGQFSAVVMAAIAGAVILLRRDRWLAAGLVLLVLVLKPQIGILVPPALFLAGYRRTAVVWGVGAAGLAALSLILLGPHGTASAVAGWRIASALPFNYFISWRVLLGSGYLDVAVQALFGGAALLVAWRHRGGGPEIPVAAGLLGSLMATPYLHTHDLVLVPLIGILLLDRYVVGGIATLVVGWIAAELIWVWGPLPLLGWEAVVLGGLQLTGPLSRLAGRVSDVDRFARHRRGRLANGLAESRVGVDVAAELPGIALK